MRQCACAEQDAHNRRRALVLLLAGARQVQNARPVAVVWHDTMHRRVGLGASSHQKLDDRDVPAERGQHQRRHAVAAACVRVGSVLEQQRADRRMPCGGRTVERRVLGLGAPAGPEGANVHGEPPGRPLRHRRVEEKRRRGALWDDAFELGRDPHGLALPFTWFDFVSVLRGSAESELIHDVIARAECSRGVQ